MSSPIFELADGTFALMHALVQTANYRRGYLQEPSDAEEEIRRIAKLQLSSDWRSAPLLLLSPGNVALDALMKTKQLPSVLCVGEFVSYRGGNATTGKPVYRYIAWLQEAFEPQMDARNRQLLRELDWNREV
jgi:hypothetical protein